MKLTVMLINAPIPGEYPQLRLPLAVPVWKFSHGLFKNQIA
jgi:hypothetical protein